MKKLAEKIGVGIAVAQVHEAKIVTVFVFLLYAGIIWYAMGTDTGMLTR